MWRRTEIARRLLTACCAALLLAGCATTRVSHVPLSVPAQVELLQSLAGFQLKGRAGVRAGAEGFNATLSWRQHGAEAQLKLSGPLGAGSMMLTYGPDALSVTTSKGEVLQDGEAERALSEQIGFVPPFAALRYWVLGLAAPGAPAEDQSTDAAGRIAQMTQLDWHIHYDSWSVIATRAGELRVPRKVTVTRPDLRLIVVVDRWQLQPAS